MASDVFTALFARMGSNKRPGGKAARDVLADGTSFMGYKSTLAGDTALTPSGKAGAMRKHLTEKVGPSLLRARRQAAHLRRQIEIDAKNLRARVLGKGDTDDKERREVMRAATPIERLRMVNADEAFALAALRGGEILSGVPGDELARRFDTIAEKFDPAGAAAMVTAQEGLLHLETAIEALQNETMKAPIEATANGSRPFMSAAELQNFLAKIPAPPIASPTEAAEAEIAG